jgi:hypothetical protein
LSSPCATTASRCSTSSRKRGRRPSSTGISRSGAGAVVAQLSPNSIDGGYRLNRGIESHPIAHRWTVSR